MVLWTVLIAAILLRRPLSAPWFHRGRLSRHDVSGGRLAKHSCRSQHRKAESRFNARFINCFEAVLAMEII